LPEGTIIRMALNEELSTGESQAGSDFSGRVASDVLSSGRVVIPQGSEVVGKVVRVTEGRRFGSPATIRLRPDVVVLPDGNRYVLRAQVLDTSGKSRVDGEGTMKPKSRVKTNVIKETAGIGTGAVAGAIIGGPPGALVGSLIGVGVMTTNILVQHPASVRVPKDSTLTLSLTVGGAKRNPGTCSREGSLWFQCACVLLDGRRKMRIHPFEHLSVAAHLLQIFLPALIAGG
jgi:hypothetical protein